MPKSEATECYAHALRQGQREYRERSAQGANPFPTILDEILPCTSTTQYIGYAEVPADRIVGVKTAGRTSAFSAGFLPLLRPDSEFAQKWIALCRDHLGDEGIRDPILCFEYLGNFYVQEGNKRVSVLKYFGAPRIASIVYRVLPEKSSDPVIKRYYEFLDFYKDAGIYDIQFRQSGGYAKLLTALGKAAGEGWTQEERRTLCAYFQYFKDAYYALGGASLGVAPEDALLAYLQVYSFESLGKQSAAELKKSVSAVWSSIVALGQPTPVEVRTEEERTQKAGLLSKLIASAPDHLNVAFVHMLTPDRSEWVRAHEQGRQEMESVFGSRVTCHSYFDANTQESAQLLLEQAVADGADVIFTTAAQLALPCLRLSVKYPKLRYFNCSVDMPYPSIRTYYSRIYEAKFITGAIAGAVASDGNIGYVSSYPILGELASINAFALGAQLTNPRAKIQLEWSCVPGDCVNTLIRSGMKVISNRDIPTTDNFHPSYGTYYIDAAHHLVPLGSPCWTWGRFYTRILESLFSGSLNSEKPTPRAVNYWWGMRSGVIDVKLSERLPEGLRSLAQILRHGLETGTIEPFRRKFYSQDGTLVNDGSRSFTPEEILHMDFLCQGIDGTIPTYDQLLARAKPMVRLLGIYRDDIPPQEDTFT